MASSLRAKSFWKKSEDLRRKVCCEFRVSFIFGGQKFLFTVVVLQTISLNNSCKLFKEPYTEGLHSSYVC